MQTKRMGVKGVSASSALAKTAAATISTASDAGGLPWLPLILFGMILLVSGARLVFGPMEVEALRYSRFKLIRRAASRP